MEKDVLIPMVVSDKVSNSRHEFRVVPLPLLIGLGTVSSCNQLPFTGVCT